MARPPARTIQTSVLGASPDEVWRALVVEMAGWPRWTQAYAPLEAPARGGPVLGDRFLLRARTEVGWIPLRSYVNEKEVTAREEARRFAWRGRHLGVEGRHGFGLSEAPGGGCALEEWFEADGARGRMLERLGIVGGIRRNMQRFHRDLANQLLTSQPAPPRREIAVDGHRVAYVDVGAGETIVLLHGYPQSHRCWRHQMAALQRTHRVIAPDLLGWGDSDRPLEADWRFEAEVERVRAFVDALGLERFDLFAHDYGGLLALGFVARHRPRVRRLALLNTRGHDTFRQSFLWPNLVAQRFFRSRLGRRHGERLPLGWIHAAGMASAVRRGLFDRSTRDAYVGALSRSAEARRWMVRFFADGYSFAPRPELAAALDDPTLPAELVWGTEDPYVPPRTPKELAARGAHVHARWLEGGDHFIMEDRPGEVTAALHGLLERPAA
jgi:pimeloyl-ACP methyl ester carboxylesterase